MASLQRFYNRYRDKGGDHATWIVAHDVDPKLAESLLATYDARIVGRKKASLSATFPYRLRQARALRGMTALDVAQRLGNGSAQSVSNLEKIHVQRSPSLRLVEALATVLGVQPAWLAFGVGEIEKDDSVDTMRSEYDFSAAEPLHAEKVKGEKWACLCCKRP